MTCAASTADDLAGLPDAYRSAARSVRLLHIHPNTLRQRLDRIAAVLPETQDPARLLEIHMALRLSALRASRHRPDRRA